MNHWDRAIETHQANHPGARHLCTGVDNINPRDLYAEDELDVLIASPECTHHSTARGGRPVNEQSRATAMCVIRWAETMRPPIIMIENVPEFRSWGPLIRKRVTPRFPSFEVWQEERMAIAEENGRSRKPGTLRQYNREKKRGTKSYMALVPDPKHKGELFEAWLAMLRATGYRVDHRIICCADYGDPTTRRRLFIQCVRGSRRKIVWPHPTHLEDPGTELALSRTKAWPTARNDVIDWSLQGLSIYERKKQLSPKTMARIMAGLYKFGLKPFIVPQENGTGPRSVDRPAGTVTTTSRGVKLVEPFLVNMKGKSKGASVNKPTPAVTAHTSHLMLAEPFIIPNFGEREGQEPRVHSVDAPAPAVTGRGAGNLIQPCLIKLRGGNPSHIESCSKSVDGPIPALTTGNNIGAVALVEPYLIKFYGTGRAASVDKPLGTVTTKHRFGLARPMVEIQGERFLLDIRFRMLQPHELAAAQGFHSWHKFKGNKTEVVKQIGNAVPRRTFRALIVAVISQSPDVSFLLDEEDAA